MSSIKTVLHPTDFSPNSEPALQTACSLARDYKAKLVLLHVMRPYAAPLMGEESPNPLQVAESQAWMRERFNWPDPSDSTIRVEHRVAEGDAPDEILRLAQALKCDLIVMGTHGRQGLGRLLTGSVAEQVLRRAGCPVLAVKTPLPGPVSAAAEGHEGPGHVIDVRPLGAALPAAKTQTLAKTDELEIVRLVVPAGKRIGEHRAKGTLVVHCLEGHLAWTALGKTQDLQAGELLYLPAGEPHSLIGVVDASLLLTIHSPKPAQMPVGDRE
jgi:nucleotide-binding universal stress UspA family protein/quercetin dioxygenase-like cupin family protein